MAVAAVVVGSMPTPTPVVGTVAVAATVMALTTAAPAAPAFNPWPSLRAVAPLVEKVAMLGYLLTLG